MNRKPGRGVVGYVILLGTLLLIAILLNGGLNQTVSRRIEYPKLLSMIKEDKVARVAVRNNSLVGLISGTITLIGTFIFMITTSWVLTLITIAFIPVFLFGGMMIAKKSAKYYAAQQAALSSAATSRTTAIFFIGAFSFSVVMGV